MKLSQDLVEYIENVVKTGQSVNIDNVIIEPGAVRAIDEDRTVVMYQNEDVPAMPFGSIGLNRVGILLSRLDLTKDREGYRVDAGTTDDGWARSLTMESADTKVGYLCANPDTIQAPKSINDTIIYQIQLNAEAVNLLQKGFAAMGAETVGVVSDERGLSFELTESVTSDVFVHTFSDHAILLEDDAAASFTHKYPVKTLLALFKQNPDGVFEIGAKGILRINVNDLTIYVLPQV